MIRNTFKLVIDQSQLESIISNEDLNEIEDFSEETDLEVDFNHYQSYVNLILQTMPHLVERLVYFDHHVNNVDSEGNHGSNQDEERWSLPTLDEFERYMEGKEYNYLPISKHQLANLDKLSIEYLIKENEIRNFKFIEVEILSQVQRNQLIKKIEEKIIQCQKQPKSQNPVFINIQEKLIMNYKAALAKLQGFETNRVS